MLMVIRVQKYISPLKGTPKLFALHCFQTSVRTFLATSLITRKFHRKVKGGTSHISLLSNAYLEIDSELCQQLFQFYRSCHHVSSYSIKSKIVSTPIPLTLFSIFFYLAKIIKTAFCILALLMKSNVILFWAASF